jgi:two-component system OmpR family response regulator
MSEPATRESWGRVLIIDDDVVLGSTLVEYLERDGFEAQTVGNGPTGLDQALAAEIDIVVLEMLVPGLHGLEVLKRIRERSAVPVLVHSKRSEAIDRILALEIGADDYVAKPCTPRELAARLRAILRRVRTRDALATHEPISVGPLRLWPGAHQAEWRGSPISLTRREFDLLEALARNAGQVVGKAALSELALGRPLARFDRSIDVHLSSLRQKLGRRADGAPWIDTVRGRGYQLVDEPQNAL